MTERLQFWRRAPAVLLFMTVAALAPAGARASSTPEAFPATDGTVYAMIASGDLIYIGGDFQHVGSAQRPNLAVIDRTNGQVTDIANVPVNGPVFALALSADGSLLFVGGSFSQVQNLPHANLAAITIGTTSRVADWTADPNAAVRAIALAADNSIVYVGGDFTSITTTTAAGSQTVNRNYLASLTARTSSGVVNPTVLPWNPNADDKIRALLLDGPTGRLYAGGDFSQIGGAARPLLAMLGVASGLATEWNPQLAGARVNALVLAGSTLYAGGSFTMAAGVPRNNIAALNVASNTAIPTPWDPDTQGEVLALGRVADGLRIYAGGSFTAAAGVPRSGIVGLRTDVPQAIAWNPGADSQIASINALVAETGTDSSTALYAGGSFTRIGGADQQDLAAFNVSSPTTTADPASGAYGPNKPLSSVVLTCTDASGAGCDRICYVVAASAQEPTDSDCTVGDTVNVPITTDATLSYFSQDLDGNREPTVHAPYALDSVLPTIVASLPAGLYGTATIQPVTLTCEPQSKLQFGCTIYYTLDGTSPLQQDNKTPALNATVYSAPISLSALFPPPNIPPAEVNPLLHMAGTVTLNAVAIDDAANVGPVPVLPVVYQVDLAPPVVTASLPSGNYPAPQTLTLTCDDGVGSGCAVMYFTTDNTSAKLSDSCNPTASAQRYTQPLVLTGGATLNVLAVDKAGNCSTKLVGIYALDNPAAETKSGGGAVDSFWLLTLLAGCAGRPLKKSLSRLSFANGSPRCRLRGTLRAPARLRFTSLRKVY